MIKQHHIQSLATLQLVAILTVVIGHYAVTDNAFLNSVGVSFCFVYSGFFTALRHEFGPSYGLRDHLGFLRGKLARFYPLHVLALLLCALSYYLLDFRVPTKLLNAKVLLAHLTLTSPWFATPSYYFGLNAVAWFLCDLFFLYLAAPWMVRGLRLLRPFWQVCLVVLLAALQLAGGYADVFTPYQLYQFPPMRLLDFGTGVVLCNVSRTDRWQELARQLTPRRATVVEVAALVVSLLLYPLCEKYLHGHCYRAYCASAPIVTVMLGTMVLTVDGNGVISRMLRRNPLAALSDLGAEMYLLQLATFFLLERHLARWGVTQYHMVHLLLQLALLLAVSWLVHRLYTAPLARRLTKPVCSPGNDCGKGTP